jgi:hypothetical protein
MSFIISSMTSHLGHSATIAPVHAATILTAKANCLWNLKLIPDMSTSPAHEHHDKDVEPGNKIFQEENGHCRSTDFSIVINRNWNRSK